MLFFKKKKKDYPWSPPHYRHTVISVIIVFYINKEMKHLRVYKRVNEFV